jgi:hypothetical protein
MFNLFNYKPKDITCHSGGAEGSDTIWESLCILYGLKVKAWSYKTKYHSSINKVEVSEEDFQEGIECIKKANKILCRKNIKKYINLLARNWSQVKYSEEIFAISKIDSLKDGIVSGGTGWAVAMAIQKSKTIYVFDQEQNAWFKWSNIIDCFIRINYVPQIQTKNFAGIGTRKINEKGKNAIEQVFINSFNIQKN